MGVHRGGGGKKAKHRSEETQEVETAANEIAERSRVRAAMTLNLWLKTDDFPFNTPLSSPLSWVLPGTVTAPLLSFCFTITTPQTIHTHTHMHASTHTPSPTHPSHCSPTVLLNIPTIEAFMTLLVSLQDTGLGWKWVLRVGMDGVQITKIYHPRLSL